MEVERLLASMKEASFFSIGNVQASGGLPTPAAQRRGRFGGSCIVQGTMQNVDGGKLGELLALLEASSHLRLDWDVGIGCLNIWVVVELAYLLAFIGFHWHEAWCLLLTRLLSCAVSRFPQLPEFVSHSADSRGLINGLLGIVSP